MVNDSPVYVSKAHKNSWGQEYRVYEDRIELKAKILFRTLVIPFDKIEVMEEKGPAIEWSDMFKHPMDFWWVYNNDFASAPYIFLKQKGWPARIRFTPDDVGRFMRAYNESRDKVSDPMG